MRLQVALLLIFAAEQLSADPCLLTYAGLFDPTVNGFTYNKVQVKKKNQEPDKAGNIVVQVTTGQTTNEITLTAKEWAMAESGCAAHNLPVGLKAKLGISGIAAIRPPAIHAALDLDHGDLNGDRLLDHVKVAFPTNALIVELAQPNGAYGPRVNFPTGVNPRAVLLADFNSDSRLDAAVAYAGAINQNNGGLSLLLGNGDGTFRPATNYATGASTVALATADFNADNRPDLAILRESGAAIVLLANSDGSLRLATELSTANFATSILAADFTGDNRPDLAIANSTSGTIHLFAGLGSGSFSNAIVTNVGAGPSYLAAFDANLDGRRDLVVYHGPNGTLSLWLAQANGQFNFANRVLTGYDFGSFAIAQHENDPPLLLAPDAVRERMLIHAFDDSGALTGEPAFLLDPSPTSLAIADFNGDRRPDVVANGSGARLYILLSAAANTYAPPQTIPLEAAANALATADFNGDGRPDLAVALPTRIAILLGQPNGAFTPGTSLPTTGRVNYLLAADFNNEGRPDLAAINESNANISIYLQEASGAFRAPATYPAGATTKHIASGDLNGDGRPDLVVTSQTSLSVFLANADGTLRSLPQIPAGREANAAALADFNNDGRLDLAYSGQFDPASQFNYQIGLLPGNGDGTFGARTAVNTGDFPGRLVAADFNADGKPDLLVPHCCGNADLARLFGNGDFSFRLERVPGGADPIAVGVADFDSDGRPDLALLSLASRSSGVLSLFRNPVPSLLHTSSASNQFQVLTPDSIATAYGLNFASAPELAPTPNWPTTLGGATVNVYDSAARNHAGRIYFVSPNQINYQIPPEVAEGFALVTVTNAQGAKQQGVIRVAKSAPGLFYTGTNIAAAALLLRIYPDGRQQAESTVLVTGAGQVVARGLTLGPDSEQEVLLLFGTGLRFRSSLAQVQATIGGVPAQVLYAGPQNEYPGLDQINILVPKSLRGRSLVDLRLFVDGWPANAVRLRFN